MFSFQKKEMTVGEIRQKLKSTYFIKDPYEIRFYNSNGHQKHHDNRSFKSPNFKSAPLLGIKTVRQLCDIIWKMFDANERRDLEVAIYDRHNECDVSGQTRYATIRDV